MATTAVSMKFETFCVAQCDENAEWLRAEGMDPHLVRAQPLAVIRVEVGGSERLVLVGLRIVTDSAGHKVLDGDGYMTETLVTDVTSMPPRVYVKGGN